MVWAVLAKAALKAKQAARAAKQAGQNVRMKRNAAKTARKIQSQTGLAPNQMGPPITLAPQNVQTKRKWKNRWRGFVGLTSGNKRAEDVSEGSIWSIIIGTILALVIGFLGTNFWNPVVGIMLGLGVVSFSIGLYVKNNITKNGLKVTGAILIVIATAIIPNYLITLILSIISYFSVSNDPYKTGAPLAASFRTLVGLFIVGITWIVTPNLDVLIRFGFILIVAGMFLFNYDSEEVETS